MLSVQLVDLTTEREALAELEEERDFTLAVLDSANTLIIVIDHEARIVRFNPAAEKLSGYTADEVRGRPVSEVVGPALGRRLREHLSAPHSHADPDQVEEDLTTRSDERRTVVWACAFLDPGRADSHLVMTGIDVTEERLAQGLVEQVLAATTGTSIIGTDLQGTITFFNPGAERLLGYTADELVGRATPAVFHDHDELQSRARELELPSEFGALVAGVEAGAEPEKRDWRYVRKDGEKIVMSLTVSPMSSASGRVVGYLGVAEDVTERRRVEDLLRVALAKERQVVERLNEVDQAKTEFVSSVSHELRTPITSVLGYTQMLQRGSGGDLTERQAKLLARVESNGLRLQALIEDLLTLSRIEAGTFDMTVSPVDLRQVVCDGLEATEVQRARARPRPRRPPGRDAGGGVGRPRPARAGGDQPALQRGEVHPRRRPRRRHPRDHGVAGAAERRGHRHRHPAGRAGPAVRAVLPLLDGSAARHPGHRPGAVDRPRDRHRARRDGLGHLPGGRRHARRAAAAVGAPVASVTRRRDPAGPRSAGGARPG